MSFLFAETSFFHTDQEASPNPVVDEAKMRLSQDLELGGELAGSVGQGAKFALLLAMLQQNILQRPGFVEHDEAAEQEQDTCQHLNHYPVVPLKAEDKHWQEQNVVNTLFSRQQVLSASLWQAMHPAPLSLHNDSLRITEEVIENCELHVQHGLKHMGNNQIDVDATGLYDILNALHPHAA